MKGIVLHPIRLVCLDRMTVLRVPFREQPPDDSWFVGIGRSRGNPVAIFQAGATQYPVRLPYAPGEYFVREVTWEPTSIIIADVYYDSDMTDEQRKSAKALFYKRIAAGRMNRDFARYLVTLGPPVPCRLGEVTEEMVLSEGVQAEWRDVDGHIIYGYCGQLGFGHKDQAMSAKGAYEKMWKIMYPKHPFSPDRWTWGYPMTWRKK